MNDPDHPAHPGDETASPSRGDPGVPGYAWDGRAASALAYGVVLVTRRRAALFADAAAATRVRELLADAAGGCSCRLVACDVGPSYVRLVVEAPPTVSPHVVVTHVRPGGAALKGEFEAARRLGAVFTRRYLVRTGPVSDADCEAFIATLRTDGLRGNS